MTDSDSTDVAQTVVDGVRSIFRAAITKVPDDHQRTIGLKMIGAILDEIVALSGGDVEEHKRMGALLEDLKRAVVRSGVPDNSNLH